MLYTKTGPFRERIATWYVSQLLAQLIQLALLYALLEGVVYEGEDWNGLYVISILVFLHGLVHGGNSFLMRSQGGAWRSIAVCGMAVLAAEGVSYSDLNQTTSLLWIAAMGVAFAYIKDRSTRLVLSPVMFALTMVCILFQLGVVRHEWWYCTLSNRNCSAIGITYLLTCVLPLLGIVEGLVKRSVNTSLFVTSILTLLCVVIFGVRDLSLGVEISLLTVDSPSVYIGSLLLVVLVALSDLFAKSVVLEQGTSEGSRGRLRLIAHVSVISFLFTGVIVLGVTVYALVTVWRTPLRIPAVNRKIPLHFAVPLLVAEDPTFFFHHGVDFVRLRDAIREAVESGGFRRGGSTISMQLAKVLFLSYEKTLIRKGLQIALALALELRYQKHEILSAYVEGVPYAPGVTGLPSVCSAVYRIDCEHLSEDQSMRAVLSVYDPTGNVLTVEVVGGDFAARQRTIRSRMRVFSPTLTEQLHRFTPPS